MPSEEVALRGRYATLRGGEWEEAQELDSLDVNISQSATNWVTIGKLPNLSKPVFSAVDGVNFTYLIRQ